MYVTKFLISIPLSEKFCCQNLITSIKVINMTGNSSKSNTLRHHRMPNEENSQYQNQNHRVYHKFYIDKCKSNIRPRHLTRWPDLTEVLKGIHG